MGLVSIVVALVAAAAVLAFALLSSHLPEVKGYARDHTASVAVAGAVSLSALALLAVLTGAMSRRS